MYIFRKMVIFFCRESATILGEPCYFGENSKLWFHSHYSETVISKQFIFLMVGEFCNLFNCFYNIFCPIIPKDYSCLVFCNLARDIL